MHLVIRIFEEEGFHLMVVLIFVAVFVLSRTKICGVCFHSVSSATCSLEALIEYKH